MKKLLVAVPCVVLVLLASAAAVKVACAGQPEPPSKFETADLDALKAAHYEIEAVTAAANAQLEKRLAVPLARRLEVMKKYQIDPAQVGSTVFLDLSTGAITRKKPPGK